MAWIPSSRQARATRIPISPRFAISRRSIATFASAFCPGPTRSTFPPWRLRGRNIVFTATPASACKLTGKTRRSGRGNISVVETARMAKEATQRRPASRRLRQGKPHRPPRARHRSQLPRRHEVELIPLSSPPSPRAPSNGHDVADSDVLVPARAIDQDAAAPASGVAALLWHWPLLLVLGAFLGTAAVIPVFADAPVGDDWVYTRSVETLLRSGEIEILDLSVVTQVFQILWGSFFSLIFGISFGAMRLSTFVLVLFSGAAMYGLCRELGLARGRAALGTAAYLFNPLTFVLAFTFMTDGQFTALTVIAAFFYVY